MYRSSGDPADLVSSKGSGTSCGVGRGAVPIVRIIRRSRMRNRNSRGWRDPKGKVQKKMVRSLFQARRTGTAKRYPETTAAVHLTSVAGNLDPAPVHQSGIWSTLAFPSFLWANYRQRRRTARLEFQSQIHPRSRPNERNTPARTYHHGDFGCSDRFWMVPASCLLPSDISLCVLPSLFILTKYKLKPLSLFSRLGSHWSSCSINQSFNGATVRPVDFCPLYRLAPIGTKYNLCPMKRRIKRWWRVEGPPLRLLPVHWPPQKFAQFRPAWPRPRTEMLREAHVEPSCYPSCQDAIAQAGFTFKKKKVVSRSGSGCGCKGSL